MAKGICFFQGSRAMCGVQRDGCRWIDRLLIRRTYRTHYLLMSQRDIQATFQPLKAYLTRFGRKTVIETVRDE